MTRIEALMQKIPAGSAALITSDINRRYFTGMKSSAGVCLVFHDEAYLLIDFRYIEKARKSVTDCNVILMKKMYSQLDELITLHKTDRLMIESKTMTVSELAELTGQINCNIDSTNALSSVISSMRMIKSEGEIQKMIAAQRIAEKALTETLNIIREGVTEREIGLCLDEHMMRMGAEALSFDTIALCGENTSLPHGVPSDRRLKSGEFILMDFGAVLDGYHSDMTRTVCLGEPSEKMEAVYSIVLEAQKRTISAAVSGITGQRLDMVARDFIAANGYGDSFGHGTGHSVGMEIHEYPNANTVCSETLTENMIMTVEPGIYLPNEFGVRIEDFVVIKNDECLNMTNYPKNLIKL